MRNDSDARVDSYQRERIKGKCGRGKSLNGKAVTKDGWEMKVAVGWFGFN